MEPTKKSRENQKKKREDRTIPTQNDKKLNGPNRPST
ncbi:MULTISPECIES: spore protein [Gracilibacillus]|nr:spore protein [Gracilibacillus dipsosauri]